MKFSEMPYERPDLAAAFSAFDAMAQAIASAPDAAAVLAQYAAFEKLAAHLSTMATLAEVRHTIDTRDAFYEAERQFFDYNPPRLADKQLEVYKAVLASPHRAAAAEKLGARALEKMERAVKTQTPEVLELMAQENALTSAYQKLYAPAQTPSQGQTLTAAQLAKYKTNADRAVRKAAYEADAAAVEAGEMPMGELAEQIIPEDCDLTTLHHPSELALMRKMADFGNLIALAARDRAPFRLTHYAQDLASLFHQFYTNCHVLTDDADVQTARLALCDATRIVLALSLNLLGVSAPVKM